MLTKKNPVLYFFCLLFILTGFTKNCFSQTNSGGKIVALHPSVGNTIDAIENKKFNLFPEYNDSLFESAQLIKYNDSSYTFLIKTIKNQSFERVATFNELQTAYHKIEKIQPKIDPTLNEKDDYREADEQYSQKDKLKRERRAETANIVGEIAYQSLMIVLEILVMISLSN